MTREELAKMLEYSSSEELYIINNKNKLQLLKCPFYVIPLYDIGVLVKGRIITVDEVKVTLKLITVYIINGDAYYYYHFRIIL